MFHVPSSSRAVDPYLQTLLLRVSLSRLGGKHRHNNLKLAETLAIGNPVPLGKHLLGSVYHLLHHVSSRLRKNQPITNLGGPWWFIQLWLHMYMHKTMVVELSEMEFPSENFSEEEETITRRCTSFGEVAIMIANDPKTLGITDFFKSF